jgi:hypothetical protein
MSGFLVKLFQTQVQVFFDLIEKSNCIFFYNGFLIWNTNG